MSREKGEILLFLQLGNLAAHIKSDFEDEIAKYKNEQEDAESQVAEGVKEGLPIARFTASMVERMEELFLQFEERFDAAVDALDDGKPEPMISLFRDIENQELGELTFESNEVETPAVFFGITSQRRQEWKKLLTDFGLLDKQTPSN